MKDIIHKYFDSWKNKNITDLGNLFASDVSLRDWLTYISGKDNLLKATKTFFNDVNQLDVNIINLYEDTSQKTVVCEIEIIIDDNKALVTDIIKINKDNKIVSITAYKG